MKIYTKAGDTGHTGLVGGQRIAKGSTRVQAIGEADELNAALGWVSVVCSIELLEKIQGWLFECGAELASPGDERFQTISLHQVTILEDSIDAMQARLPELRNFILPGGSEEAARLHLARAICRRAERSVLFLNDSEPQRPELLVFLNRLSDWLFVAARTANAVSNVQDLDWKRGS